MQTVNVKGSALVSRLAWLRLHHGDEGLTRVMANGSKALGYVASGRLAKAEWYPFTIFCELNEVIDRTYGSGDLALVRELGRNSAEANLTTIYRLFLQVGSPKWTLERAARLWNLYYDSGKLVVSGARSNAVRAEIIGFATPHRVHCVAVLGWMERALELAGAKRLVIDETTCRARGESACVFESRWS